MTIFCYKCKKNVEDNHKHDGNKIVLTYEPELANKKQVEYCERTNTPHFAPSGKCWNCCRNIFLEGGISVEEASGCLITGCPFCHRSYCD